MDPEEAARRERDREAVRKEMYRKSRDTIRIYNPLEQDFKFYYDGYPNLVKAKSSKDVARYLARHYFKKIADFIIGQLALVKGENMLEERRKRGLPDFLDKYVENKEVWEKVAKQNDPELLKEIGDKVILGLVEEYGLEVPDEAPSADFQPMDMRSIHDQVVDLFDKRIADEHPVEEAPLPEVNPIKQKLRMEI